jgi:N utilization substance protein A
VLGAPSEGEGEEGQAPQLAVLVIVPDNQLSLAIGKKGQNARLGARLTGIRIDIKSESEVEADRLRLEEEVAEGRAALQELPGVEAALVEKLVEAGIHSPVLVARADRERLAAIPGVGDEMAERLAAEAREWVDQHAPPASPEAAESAPESAEERGPSVGC